MSALPLLSMVYFKHARENKNVTSICRLFNITRNTCYVWLRQFSRLGYLGLLDRQRSKPSMPNKIKPDVELIIYNYIRDYPTHGLGRIVNELAIGGLIISPGGVYNECLKEEEIKPPFG